MSLNRETSAVLTLIVVCLPLADMAEFDGTCARC